MTPQNLQTNIIDMLMNGVISPEGLTPGADASVNFEAVLSALESGGENGAEGFTNLKELLQTESADEDILPEFTISLEGQRGFEQKPSTEIISSPSILLNDGVPADKAIFDTQATGNADILNDALLPSAASDADSSASVTANFADDPGAMAPAAVLAGQTQAKPSDTLEISQARKPVQPNSATLTPSNSATDNSTPAEDAGVASNAPAATATDKRNPVEAANTSEGVGSAAAAEPAQRPLKERVGKGAAETAKSPSSENIAAASAGVKTETTQTTPAGAAHADRPTPAGVDPAAAQPLPPLPAMEGDLAVDPLDPFAPRLDQKADTPLDLVKKPETSRTLSLLQSPAATARDFAVSIRHHLQNGVNRFELRLDPPELGRIDIRLEINDDGRVQAQLAFDKPEAMDAFSKDARALEKAMQEAGLDLSKDDLTFEMNDRDADGGAQDDDTNGPRAEEDADEPAQQTYVSARDGVDIRI